MTSHDHSGTMLQTKPDATPEEKGELFKWLVRHLSVYNDQTRDFIRENDATQKEYTPPDVKAAMYPRCECGCYMTTMTTMTTSAFHCKCTHCDKTSEVDASELVTRASKVLADIMKHRADYGMSRH